MTNLAYKQRANRVNARKDAIEQNRIRIGFERKLRLQLQTAFAEIGQWASDSYERIARVPNTQFIPNKISSILLPHYRSVIESFAKRFQTYQKQEAEFDRIINSFLRTQGGIHITQVSDTTRKRIMRAIQVAQADDLSVALTAKAILDSQTGFISKRRASTIARTETHTAASFANHEMAKDSQIPNLQKQWVAVNDARTRGAHSAVSGTIIPMDEDFDVVVRGITYKMGYPSDPRGGAANVVNCRCTLIYVTPEDEIEQDPILPTEIETPEASKLDIGGLLKTGSKKVRQQFSDKLNDNLSPLALSVAVKLRKPNVIRKTKKGRYNSGSERIDASLERNTLEHEYGHHVDNVSNKSNKKRYRSETDKDFQRAFIDDAKALGLAVDGTDFNEMLGFRLASDTDNKLKELRETLLVKVEKTKTFTRGRRKGRSYNYLGYDPRFDGANSISDIVDAMVKGIFYSNYSAWGHGKNYYKRSGSFYYETFANLYAINGKQKAMDQARKLFPRTVREFERMLKEILDE